MKKIYICTGKTCTEKQKQREDMLIKTGSLIDSCGCLKKCGQGPNIKIVSDMGVQIKTGITSRMLAEEVEKKPITRAKNGLNNLLSGGF